MANEITGIVEESRERRAAYAASYPQLARRILGKRPLPPVAGKTHAITVDLRTGARTVATATANNPFEAASTKPRPVCLPPVRATGVNKATPIIAAVCRAWDVTADDMRCARRPQRLARPRFAAYHIMRHTLNWSLPQIGRQFGNRDHTTIMSGLRRAEYLIVNDADWSQRYAAAVEELKGIGQ